MSVQTNFMINRATYDQIVALAQEEAEDMVKDWAIHNKGRDPKEWSFDRNVSLEWSEWAARHVPEFHVSHIPLYEQVYNDHFEKLLFCITQSLINRQ